MTERELWIHDGVCITYQQLIYFLQVVEMQRLICVLCFMLQVHLSDIPVISTQKNKWDEDCIWPVQEERCGAAILLKQLEHACMKELDPPPPPSVPVRISPSTSSQRVLRKRKIQPSLGQHYLGQQGCYYMPARKVRYIKI